MAPMPTIFISHGGPNIVTDESDARTFLETLPGRMPKPKAIVIMSAHFETDGVAVVTDDNPEMIHDFGGFARELYEMVYPAPGEPKLAERVAGLLEAAGLEPSRVEQRGYDHGTWTPLKLAFPEADIPVVQVSIDPRRDAQWHHQVGKALAPLRDEGVLLVGSGHITHNLKVIFPLMRGGATVDPVTAEKVDAFTQWFAETLEGTEREAVLDWKRLAPYSEENHPTDEHLMPLFFAFGAAGEGASAERVHASKQFGCFAFDSYMFG
ncbi:class III extradiol ring-cleavage dioxygenase [Mesorhizobium sp. CAU 1741]|uniref:DODA-type extradiol aromatic ring-opening family dioxygenase n=1 Tax=Mesorhizobium sp. CAU 1741 TaxID=3140366 RepID=UPI00325AC601